jgi:type IV secretion system protein VirB9
MTITKPILAGLFVLGLAASAFAVETPRQAPDDGRIRFVDYQPFNVVRIVGTLRSSVQIEFAADEDIAHAALGNTVAWEIAPAGNILFLKPRENQPATNLSVVTTRRDGSKRSYQLELTMSQGKEGRDGSVGPAPDAFFYVKYRYPADDAERRRQEAAQRNAITKSGEASQVLAFHETHGPRNWRYTAQGATAIEPKSVYDNGKVTTMAFAGNTEIPAIFLVNTDGTESLVPKSVQGELVLVHAIAAKFILRRGHDVLCLYNEGYKPEGLDPGTKTTSPAVERIVAGPAVKAPMSVASPLQPPSVTAAPITMTPPAKLDPRNTGGR